MPDNKPIRPKTTKTLARDDIPQTAEVKSRDANKKPCEPIRNISYPSASGQWHGPDYNFNDGDW